jgi:hypothetical protein
MSESMPTREQIAEALYNRWRQAHSGSLTWGTDADWRRAEFYGPADAVLALFSQPSPSTPSAEPDVDVCFYCLGAGYHDGGDMRDDEPCSACRGTGLAEPPRIEDMAPGTSFTASRDWGARLVMRFMVTKSSQCVDHNGTWANASSIDPSTVRDVTPPPTHSKDNA